MQPPKSLESPVDPHDAPPPAEIYKPTPLSWRLAILIAIVMVGLAAYQFRESIGLRGQAFAGVIFFFGIVAAFSSNLRAVNWHTIFWGVGLQVVLALLVLGKDKTYLVAAIACFAAIILAVALIHLLPVFRGGKLLWPGLVGGIVTIALAYWILFIKGVHEAFDDVGSVVRAFIDFSDQGAQFVFGNLAKPGDMAKVFGNDFIFCFAFKALPPILFVSAFFTVLYHFGVLQWCVRARIGDGSFDADQWCGDTVRGGECFYGTDRSAANA